jgi:hypothetical protein
MIRILLGLIVILGIVCLYQINKQREGLEESGSESKSKDKPKPITAEGAKVLAASIKTQMVEAGVPTPSEEEMGQLFEQLSTLVKQEVAAAGSNMDAIYEAEDTTPVENTVAPTLPFADTSFFTGDNFGSAFCPINQENPTQLINQCSLLTADSCNATDCCIWINGTKCVAGDASGPMEMNLDAKYYSHKYQCHGGCPPSPPT